MRFRHGRPARTGVVVEVPSNYPEKSLRGRKVFYVCSSLSDPLARAQKWAMVEHQCWERAAIEGAEALFFYVPEAAQVYLVEKAVMESLGSMPWKSSGDWIAWTLMPGVSIISGMPPLSSALFAMEQLPVRSTLTRPATNSEDEEDVT